MTFGRATTSKKQLDVEHVPRGYEVPLGVKNLKNLKNGAFSTLGAIISLLLASNWPRMLIET
jgi:6,7-dimethyl-8-ribityllumazine synthase